MKPLPQDRQFIAAAPRLSTVAFGCASAVLHQHHHHLNHATKLEGARMG